MTRGSLRRQLFLVILAATIPVFVLHEVVGILGDLRVTRAQGAVDTRVVAAAAVPLLKSALIVGDLATAQETLDSIAHHGQFRSLRLVDPGTAQLLAEGRPAPAASPTALPATSPDGVPNWFVEWIDYRFPAQGFPIAAGGTQYGTLVAEPSSRLLIASIWARVRTAVPLWLVTLAIFATLLKVVFHRGLKPLDDLAEAALRFGEGDLTRRAPVSSVPELAETARAFNRMADHLAEARDRLEERVRQATRELENLITRIPVGVSKLRFPAGGTGYRYDYVSPRWCELLGIDAQTVARDPSAPLVCLHPDEVAGFEGRFAAAREGMTPFQWEGRLRDGLPARWMRIEAMPTVLDNGDVLWEGIQYDVTERRQAEDDLRASEEKLRGLYELSPLGIALTDMQGGYIEFNEAFRAICGYPADELRRLDYWALTPRKYEPDERRQLESLRLTGRYGPYEKEYRRQDGTLVPLRLNGMLVQGPDGAPRIWSIVEDIARQKRDEAALQQTIRELDNLVARIPVGVYKLRRPAGGTPRFDYVSPRWCELLELEAVEVYRDPQAPLTRIEPEDAEAFAEQHEAALAAGAPFEWEGRLRKGLRARWVHIESTPTVLDNGDVLWEGIQYDITANKAREAELDLIAHYDPLTGIPNRTLLADRMHQAIAQARRTRGSVAVCYIDLDGFKPVNDALGHEAGDAVLVEVARRLRATVRGGDTVARIGGDEFVLLLAGMAGADEYDATLNRILATIAAPIAVASRMVSISASVGVSLYPQDDLDPDLLLRHADQAMYRAKQAGRGKFCFFDPNLEEAVRRHRDLLTHIETGMSGNELELHYQPKVNMRLGTVVGFEALVRWRDPARGLLHPEEILTQIADSDLVVALGDWAIDRALTQLGIWHRRGLSLSVSVNISPRHLRHGDFALRLRQHLAIHADAPPDRLEIEIVESAALASTAAIADLIAQCRRLGVSFALDDFGAGYSSLTYFKDIPAQTIKIDRSYVRDMLVDANDLAIVEGVIGLTECFRRQVVAEGVESTEQGTLLLNMGCELAQGSGIAQPMPADRVDAWLQAWRPHPDWGGTQGLRWPRDDLPLVVAQNHHRAWVEAVAAYLDGSASQPPEVDGTLCHFGHWYLGAGRRRYGRIPQFCAIDEVHARVHDLARDLVGQAEAGDRGGARARLPALYALRDELLQLLRGFKGAVGP